MSCIQEFIRALELALHETSSPLSIAEECLTQRENRTGVDRVHDDVELALTKVSRQSDTVLLASRLKHVHSDTHSVLFFTSFK